jgi:DNA primase
MRIPEHIIEQVRSQSNIVDVIGEHVRLKQTGRSFTGLCPFHKEKSPSFHVNPERSSPSISASVSSTRYARWPNALAS